MAWEVSLVAMEVSLAAMEVSLMAREASSVVSKVSQVTLLSMAGARFFPFRGDITSLGAAGKWRGGVLIVSG
ncbi:hypothetical protein PR001_g6977 [Phytophthora rubi]|uniref:Uncharacterized protein n=2 Tax=Phytophthora rubi TaxID=129364 RepID=A0A6A3N593_9STRA|nr:hypothetical protein PR001_g6977 [Phytophthora rubi]